MAALYICQAVSGIKAPVVRKQRVAHDAHMNRRHQVRIGVASVQTVVRSAQIEQGPLPVIGIVISLQLYIYDLKVVQLSLYIQDQFFGHGSFNVDGI